MIIIKEVTTKKELVKFTKFPFTLYKNCEAYVGSFIKDELAMFNPSTNDAFTYCQSKQFLAYQDGKIVGRIAYILNKRYNEKIGVKQLRFTRFDSIDKKEVIDALFSEIKKHAERLDCEEIIGPIGFCDLDKQGLLVEGFEHLNMYITPYNYPYYQTLLEDYGFMKRVDWVEYRIEIPTIIDEDIVRVAKYVQERYRYKVLKMSSTEQIMGLIDDGLKIMNKVYSHLYGYVELTDLQIEQFKTTLKPIIHPDFVCAVLNDKGQLIGYGFVAPSISKAIKKSAGRITIKTLWRLIKALKINDTIDLYSIGVLHEYQNTGVNAIIMHEILKSCQKHNIKYAESGPELETNNQIQSQWKKMDKTQHKRRRCYYLPLK